MGVHISRGSTTYFLIEPKAVGATTVNDAIQVVIEELGFGMVITSGLGISVMELNANNDLVNTYPQPYVTGGVSRVSISGFTQADYDAGHKILIRITEPNEGSTSVNIKWR